MNCVQLRLTDIHSEEEITVSYEFIGAKLFPDRYERDRIIWDYIKQRNKTEVLKEALYRMAIAETVAASANKDILQQIAVLLSTQQVQAPNVPNAHVGPQITHIPATSDHHMDTDVPDVDSDAVLNDSEFSLESLETTSDKQPKFKQPNVKALRDNFLSSLSNVKF